MKGITPIIGAIILLAVVAFFAMKPASIYDANDTVLYSGLTCTVINSGNTIPSLANEGRVALKCSDGSQPTPLEKEVTLISKFGATPTPVPVSFGAPAPTPAGMPVTGTIAGRIPVISDIGDFLAGIIGAVIGFIAIPFLPP